MRSRADLSATAGSQAEPLPPAPRKTLAIVTTVWRYLSHAQHMGDRFLVGYPYEGRWHRPAIDVVALYVDQKPEGDQSAERAASFGFKVYPTIAEALRTRRDEAGGRWRADHRRARRLSDATRKARSSTRGTSSSARWPTSSRPTAAPCRSSTTSTCRTASPRPRRWSTPRSAWASRSWPARRCRSPGGCPPSSFRSAARSKTPSWSAWAGPTRWTFTRWRPCSACSSAGEAARPACGGCS